MVPPPISGNSFIPTFPIRRRGATPTIKFGRSWSHLRSVSAPTPRWVAEATMPLAEPRPG
jgi:hypothetical protein